MLLLSILLMSGCAASIDTANRFSPQPDGRYDNNTYLINSPKMNLQQISNAIITLRTETMFETQNGKRALHVLEGSGVVVGDRFVLTVEHSVSQHEIVIQTPFGKYKSPVKKVSEENFVVWEGKNYPLRIVYENKLDDVALFELPPLVRPPSFPYTFGNSDDLRVGNYIYVVGNPLNLGVNVREGIVSAMKAPTQISEIDAKGENAFMVSNGLMPGDSGTPVIAIRDGNYELVGLSQGTFLGGTRLGWVIRINVIRELLLTAQALSEGRQWAAPPRVLPVSAQGKRGFESPWPFAWLGAVKLNAPSN